MQTSLVYLFIVGCLFVVCFLGVTTHCVCIIHSPVAGFSFLIFLRYLDHTQRRATVGRTPLDEWSIRRRDLYLTTHNTHNRQTSMPPVGFEPTISAGERPKTYALDRTPTGTGVYCWMKLFNRTETARRSLINGWDDWAWDFLCLCLVFNLLLSLRDVSKPQALVTIANIITVNIHLDCNGFICGQE
jgi:hypothetical protein